VSEADPGDAPPPEAEEATAGGARAGRGDARGSGFWLIALAFGLAVQLVALYSPRGGGQPPFPGADKFVHATIFAVPVIAGLLARLRGSLVVGLAAAHAPVSEIVQATLLPQRDGDVWDAAADLTGVLVGWVVARWLVSRR